MNRVSQLFTKKFIATAPVSYTHLIPNQVSATPYFHQSAKHRYHKKSWPASTDSSVYTYKISALHPKLTTGIVYQQIYKLRFVCHIIELL